MFNPLKGLGDMAQMKRMRDELAKEEVTLEENGIKVTVRGDQQIQEISIDGVMENRVAKAINNAIKKTQEIGAKKMWELMKDKDSK